jgi:ribose transport system ATP-binding protein
MTVPEQLTGAGGQGLSLRGIGKNYGPVTVLSDVDLDVRPGELLALLGENGAGKSTVSSIIAGLVPATTGSMIWRGKPYAPDAPADALSAGIGLIHQEMRLLLDLSIAENVFIGRLPIRRGRIDREVMNRRAAEQLHRLGLDASPTTRVRDLRVAAQQQVEIAKALTLNARLLIFDEPTAALGGEETERLFEQIGRLKSEGVSFIYISHRLDEIARIADRIVVLRDGRLVATHDDAQVPVKTLVEEMVGRPLDRIFPEIPPPPSAAPLIEVEGLTSAEGAFTDVSFSVQAGEVFGVAGIVGAGRTELMRAISGADPIAAGRVKVGGDVLRLDGPRDALDHGVVLVPEDRKAQGLILAQTIADNLALGNYDRVAPSGWVTTAKTQKFAARGIRQFLIKGAGSQLVSELSGGNQQKVVIAKSILREPKVVILDEPTRGIDVGARAAIYDIIADLARRGMAVIVVSSDLDEVLGLSHRVMVLNRGSNRGILDRQHAGRAAVMELAAVGEPNPDPNAQLAEPRRRQILDWLQEEGSARVRDLSHAFGVSEATIWKDLEKLESDGHINRQHGSAFLRSMPKQVQTLSLQHMENIEKKRKIGVKAASLVGDGETIILDAGSTTTEIARNLLGRSSLTVITNALNIALTLGAVPGYAVHMPGGQFKAPTLSLSGDKAADYFHDVQAGKLFLATGGVSLDSGLTYPSLADLQIKQAMIRAASHVYLVVDSTKINRSSFTRLGPLDVIHSVITDDGIRAEDVRAFENRGIKVIVAN